MPDIDLEAENERLRRENGELHKAAEAALRTLRALETDWSMLTDDQHGRFPGYQAMRRLQTATAKGDDHA